MILIIYIDKIVSSIIFGGGWILVKEKKREMKSYKYFLQIVEQFGMFVQKGTKIDVEGSTSKI